MGNSKNLTNIKSKKFHFTYQTKCLINGKLYIGRHSTNDLFDGYIGSGKLLKRAVKKYGYENFICTPLCFFDSYEELLEEERFLVTKNWCKKDSNYNLVEGGENPIMYGENNPSWKGGVSKDPLYRVTGRVHNFKKENNPRWGYQYSQEEKDKMRDLQNSVKFYADGILYNSLKEFRRLTGRSKDYAKRRINSLKFPNWRLVKPPK